MPDADVIMPMNQQATNTAAKEENRKRTGRGGDGMQPGNKATDNHTGGPQHAAGIGQRDRDDSCAEGGTLNRLRPARTGLGGQAACQVRSWEEKQAERPGGRG